MVELYWFHFDFESMPYTKMIMSTSDSNRMDDPLEFDVFDMPCLACMPFTTRGVWTGRVKKFTNKRLSMRRLIPLLYGERVLPYHGWVGYSMTEYARAPNMHGVMTDFFGIDFYMQSPQLYFKGVYSHNILLGCIEPDQWYGAHGIRFSGLREFDDKELPNPQNRMAIIMGHVR